MKKRCMTAAAAVLLFFITVFWPQDAGCLTGALTIRPLLGWDGSAQISRLELASILYRRGVDMERSGNLADAVRYWYCAYNMDDGSGIISGRLLNGLKMLARISGQRYREALFDLQYGRLERAKDGFRISEDILDGIAPAGADLQIDIEKTAAVKRVKQKSDVWLRLEKINEVEELVAAGDTGGALIKLDALAEEYPKDPEIKNIGSRLNGSEKESNNDSAVEREKADLANGEWLNYLGFKESGDIISARGAIMAIKKIYGNGGKKPTFLDGLEEEAVRIEEMAEGLAADRMKNISEKLDGLSSVEDLDKRLGILLGLYDDLNSMLSDMEGLGSAVGLKGKVVGEIGKNSRIFLAKASTLKRLEGCAMAVPEYRRLVDILGHPELGSYQAATEELHACEK